MRKFMAIFACLCLLGAAAVFLLPQAGMAGNQENIRLVTDSTGREVRIPQHPKRVVILNASNIDLYVAAGGEDTIVGKASSKALSPEVVKATEKAAEVGIIHSPDVEKILSLKPDLVIGTNVPFHTNLADTLAQAGIPLYIQSLDSMEELTTALQFYGTLTGEEAKAQAAVAKMAASMAAVKGRTAGKNPPKSLIVFGSPDSFNMGTGKCFTGSLLNELGGGNIADQAQGEGGYLPISMEFVARENPEVIFIIMHGQAEELEAKMRQELASSEAWQNIAAVQQGRVYILPYELFAVNPGVRTAEALQVLAEDMYR
ncbi:iron complex transport system substrate-binding protein [Selenomonas ruminantium]|uniref:Iron complex transport system substrate-binding protein n=1 Tax=Selenomonas ruminantium TaxID=971 RepID=A0A1M6USS6_SELRU|nr:ABC transporter substrate-binding protein [Selenomonas ruminantium]SHK72275.1 iron complex transport system substrate-binding protein [Selenomonas ruminantium]